jgi:hypothetical protein
MLRNVLGRNRFEDEPSLLVILVVTREAILFDKGSVGRAGRIWVRNGTFGPRRHGTTDDQQTCRDGGRRESARPPRRHMPPILRAGLAAVE